MILDVLVPIEFCLMGFLRPLTPNSGAYFQKHAFRQDETTIFEVFENSQTNSTWHVLMLFLKAVNPLFWCIFSKTSISPRRNYHFWGLWEFSKYSTWHVLIPVLVTATLRVLPRTFADLDCLRYNASTTWTHGKFQRTFNSVAWRMSGKFERTYSHVAWRMSGQFQRTYNSVAWRMSGKFQRTYSNVAWCMSGKFQRTYIAWHDAWVESSRERTEKHVLPPQVHMNVITCPTPPNPTRAYMHLPAATDKHVLPPQVPMKVITCPTPPHPTPPMCTKHHGLLKAVVQLTIHPSIHPSIHPPTHPSIHPSIYLSYLSNLI